MHTYIYDTIYNMWHLKKKPKLWKHRVERWLPGSGMWGKWKDNRQRVHICSYIG